MTRHAAAALLASACAAFAQENRRPEVTAPPAYAPAIAYVGDSIRFTVGAVDPDGDPLTYSWNFGDNSPPAPASASPLAVHVYAAPGRYPAIVRIRDSLQAVTASVMVAVHLRGPRLRPTAASSIILDTARGRIWCVNPDNHSVSAVDAGTLELTAEVPTGHNPQTLALAPDGHVWVANKGASTLTVLAPGGTVAGSLALPYGSAPHGIAFAPDGSEAYVTLEGSGKLIRLDPAARRVTAELALGPTPRGLAVTSDGRILVTRFLSPEDHAQVWEVGAAAFAKIRTFVLEEDFSPDDETGGAGVLNYLQSIAVSPTGREAVVPAKKDNVRRGLFRNGIPLTFENTVRTVTARLDLAANREDPLLRNDQDNASLASAAVYSPLGDFLFVALQGNNAVHVLDPYNNGAVLERIPSVGAAPRGLAVDGARGRLYVHNFLDRAVAVYAIDSVLANTKYESRRLKSIPTVVREALPPAVLRGKRIFYDAGDSAMSRDGYISCAVCHLDGGSDGRVWDFTDRGEGLRRTTSLLGRAGLGHGPVHWTANFDEIQDFEHDIRGPFGGKGFMADADFNSGTRNATLGDRKAGLSADLDALAAYVASLAKVSPSPFRHPDGSLTADALAGEAIFLRPEVGCAKCHVPPLYTDSEMAPVDFTYGIKALPGGFRVHDVGTLKPSSGRRLADTLRGLDTPTLLGVWETAPYLHDGSAAGLMDVLAANDGDRHGRTSHLTTREREQLVAFLQQLDQGRPAAGTRPGRPAVRKPSIRVLPGADGVSRLVLSGWNAPPRLAIWDGRGRLVKSFAAGDLRSGRDGAWVVDWKGSRTGNRMLPAGIYLAVATSPGASISAPLPWFP